MFFFFFFNCTCRNVALNHLLMRMDASRVCYDEVSDRWRNFWERATKHAEPKVAYLPKVEAVFPSLQPAVHSVRRHVHHLPQQTRLRIIDLTHEARQ